MEDRYTQKQAELEQLRAEYQKNPELFERTTTIETHELLDEFGIAIPKKGDLPVGYIKLWPQDFIVEEIDQEGNEITISKGDGNALAESNPDAKTTFATLVKAGLSTLEAIDELASNLGIQKTTIQYAGIKDKDAITAQRISWRQIPLKTEQLKSEYFFLKDIKHTKGGVSKGGLKGNRFSIFVRTQPGYDKKALEDQIESLNQNGFYNYFYLQRFGTPRLMNFYWGYLILRGEYQQAINHFLTEPAERELGFIKNLRESLKPLLGDWEKIQKVLEPYPLMFQNELKVVRHLENHPDDPVGALQTIPEQITLWVYAFSSWLFNNRIASYIKTETPVPEKLPVIMSRDKGDHMPYKQILEQMDVWPIPLQNLKPFRAITLRHNELQTRINTKIDSVAFHEEGFALSFVLPKGAYATTLLSHLFQIASGPPPEGIKDTAVDVKKLLKKESGAETIERFKKVLEPKSTNSFL